MPIFMKTIRGTTTSVIHPIVEQLVTRLLSSIGIGKLFGNNIYYNSDSTKSSETMTEDHKPKLNTNRCDITMDYSTNPTTAKWEDQRPKPIIAYGMTPYYKNEDIPIFYDKRPEILIKEHLNTCTIRLTIDMQIQSIDIAHSIMDAIISRHHVSSIMEYQDIYYTYPLPADMLLLMYKFYKLRNFDTPLDFKKYLQAGSMGSVSFDKNRQGNDTEVVVLKNNNRVLTEVTFSQEKPVVTLTNSIPDFYMVSFAYDIQFLKPTNLTLYYPVVIDNSLIPEMAWPNIESHKLLDDEVVIIDVAEQRYIFNAYVEHYITPLTRFPLFDDWNVPDNNYLFKHNYRPFFIGAFTLDTTTTDGVTTINEETHIDLINHMPQEYQCHPIIQDALKIQGNSSFFIEGIFNISIFTNEDRLDPELLSIDENLIITVKATLPYRRYHIVISELLELERLNPIYIPIIFHYADFFGLTLIRNINYLLRTKELFWDDRYIKIGTTRQIMLPDGSFTDNTEYNSELYGISYESIGGYGEAVNHYLVTKQGYPILKGGSNGINYPWRIGKYVINANRE